MMTISGVVALTILATFIWCLMGVGTITLLRMLDPCWPKVTAFFWPILLVLIAMGMIDGGKRHG